MDAAIDTKENETRAFINTAKKRGIDLVPAGAGNTEPTSAQEAFTREYKRAYREGATMGKMGASMLAAYNATKHLNKPQDIRNAIKFLLDWSDDVTPLTNDPDFQTMWKALEAEVAVANEKAKTEHTKSILQVAMLDITEQAKDITEELNNPTVGIKEAITSAQKGIEILHDTLDGVTNDLAQVTIKRERSPQEMIAEATDGTDVYACGVFHGIEFKHGTLSFIGARTSRGKTTAMTSVAVDALQSERRILFLTLEETDRQILRRLIMCLAYMNAYDKGDKGDKELLGKLESASNPFYDDTERGKLQKLISPLSAYKAWEYRLTHHTNRIISPVFASAMDSAYKQVEAWHKNNMIVFHNGAGEDFRPLVTATRQAGNSDIILFDYAQLAPANGVVKDSYGKKIAVDETDKALLATAREKGCVVIAGAQFNRADTTKDDLGDDVFSDKSFADCGNMETDAHILIGIGWNDCNHDARFYKVLKNREGNGGDEYTLHFNGAYSFMYGTEKREVIPADSKRPQMWEALKKAVDKGKSAAELGNIVLRYMGKGANKSKSQNKWHSQTIEIGQDTNTDASEF